MLDQAVLEQWMAAAPVPGVAFGLSEPVIIEAGPFAGSLGTVVALVALTPEPLYTVEIGGGRSDIHALESNLIQA
jgi:hypothetical protein